MNEENNRGKTADIGLSLQSYPWNDAQDLELESEFKPKVNVSKYFSVKYLKRRLPLLGWIPLYSANSLICDLIAGITVSLLLMPQALAYGMVAGLPPNYGLYSSIMGCFVYFILGSVKELTIGPTAIMSLMTMQYSNQGGPDYAIFLCFFAGIIEFLAAVLNLGVLINYISEPVISGFTSAAAITIASSQLKGLFGLSLKTKGVIDTWYQIAANIMQTRWQDLVLGVCSLIFLEFMKRLSSMKIPCLEKGSKHFGVAMTKILFFLSVARNAIVVLIAAIVSYVLNANQPFTLTGEITAGLPTAQMPPFSTTINNVTMSFMDIVNDLGIGLVTVPFIAILDDIAVVGATSKGTPFEAKQEILTLGIINILGAFIGSMPTTASLSRTAVNKASGVQTPTSGLVTGCFIILSLAFLTPLFEFIPKSTLSALVICAVVSMIDYEIVLPMWRANKLDLIPLVVTFVACLLLGVEWGVLLGIAVHLSLLLFFIATPPITIRMRKFQSGQAYILTTPSSGISYPNFNGIRSRIMKSGLVEGKGKLPVVVNCYFITSIDYTSARGLKVLIDEFDRRKQALIFLNLRPPVLRKIKPLKDILACDSLVQVEEAIQASLTTDLGNGYAMIPLISSNA